MEEPGPAGGPQSCLNCLEEPIAEEAEACLGLDIEGSWLRDIRGWCCAGISEAVDHLHRERLIIAQKLKGRVREPFPHAGIEADGLFCSRLANTASSVQDRCLKEHLESVIKENENTMRSASIGRTVEELTLKTSDSIALAQSSFYFLFSVSTSAM